MTVLYKHTSRRFQENPQTQAEEDKSDPSHTGISVTLLWNTLNLQLN